MSDDQQHLGDIASDVAESLKHKHLLEIESGERQVDLDERVMRAESNGRSKLFTKIEFNWRQEDRMILEQIRGACRNLFAVQFEDAIIILDELYGRLRVPASNEHGVVRTDGQGRTLWVLGANNKPIENWDQLTGQDIEQTLFDLQRLRFGMSNQLNELLMEALFAKHIYDDAHSDGYSSVLDGTINDREARASRESRQDKYQAFFRYFLFSQGDAFMRELKSFQYLLERVREWRVRTQRD